MRFLIFVKATPESEAEAHPAAGAPQSLIDEMTEYHEALAKAGVLLDYAGLKPTSAGWRIRFADGKRIIVDGPFAESKELVAGYTLIQTKTREEAYEWARRFPAPMPGGTGEIEVRELYELEDFAPDVDVERFRKIGRS